MTDAENILNDDEFFANTVDTPNEGVEQHRKLRVFKVCKKQRKSTRCQKIMDTLKLATKLSSKHVISLYSTAISQVVKVRNLKI